MKKIYRKEEGVSPVIATILMVAITVVLAATVYIMVAGLGGGGGGTPLSMGLTYSSTASNDTRAVFDVSMTSPTQASFTSVKVNLQNASGGLGKATVLKMVSNVPTATITIGTGTYAKTYTVTVTDLNGNGKLDSGDQIILDGGKNSVAGFTIYIYVTGYTGHATQTVPT